MCTWKVDAQYWLEEVTSSVGTHTHVASSAGRETTSALGRRWLDSQATQNRIRPSE